MRSASKCLVMSVIMVVLLSWAGWAAAEEPQLCVGDYQTEAQAKEQLARFAKTYSNRAEWQQRAQRIREGILRGAELSPLPKKGPLNPIVHSN